MKYTVQIRAICGKENECKLADVCTQLGTQTIGEIAPLASEDPDRTSELQRYARNRMQGRKLALCTEKENPLHGRAVQLAWSEPLFIPVYK